MRTRVVSADIKKSFLAKDNLNHLKELAIIMELLSDMSKFVEDVKY